MHRWFFAANLNTICCLSDVSICLSHCALTLLEAWFSISFLELVTYQVVYAMKLGGS